MNNTYKLKQYVKSPMGNIKKGTLSKPFTDGYIIFLWKGQTEVKLGNGLVISTQNVDEKWFEKIN
jgi:hypothetical protein